VSWRNWGGTASCEPTVLARPETEADLRELVASSVDAGDTVRIVGSGHSFTELVPTDDVLLSLERFTGVVAVDRDAEEVTVRAGTTLATLNRELADHGLAMANLGDIDRQTIAGAVGTGTHGTGLDFGTLSSQVVGCRLVTADGSVRELDADGDSTLFEAARVSLGALGVLSTVTLSVVPAYDLRLQREARPLDAVLTDVDRYHTDHDQWEFFWFPHTDTALVKTYDRKPAGTGDPGTGRFDTLGDRVENAAWETICRVGTHAPVTAPTGAKLAAATLSDKTEVGPSHEVFANAREVRFSEMEYGVPADEVVPVVRRIRAIADGDRHVQFPVEVRFVGGDQPLLSPAHARDSAFVAVHTYHRKAYREYFDRCEAVFREFGGRPHWGKLHTADAATLAERYPRWDAFQSVRRELDPDGAFLNEHLRDVFGVE